MLKKEWTKAIIDWLLEHCPEELQRNDIKAVWDTISKYSLNIDLKVNGYKKAERIVSKDEMIFLISLLYQDRLHINNLYETLAYLKKQSFSYNEINLSQLAQALEKNVNIVIVCNEAIVGFDKYQPIYVADATPNKIKFTFLLKLNNNFTFENFTEYGLYMVRGQGYGLDIVLDKNCIDKDLTINMEKLISFCNRGDKDTVTVKVKFYPIADENGDKATPFKIYSWQEDMIREANILEPIK